jgi:putative copper export protein/mono/diheme cytochrome c family protein
VTAALALTTLIRWAGLTALATALGGLVMDLLVLPRGAAGLDPARARLRRAVWLALAALLVTTAAELVVRSGTMAGGDLGAALAAVPAVLGRTHFGRIWLVRAVAVALALAAAASRARPARGVALLLVAAVGATTTLTGHAADRGDLSPSAAADWLHVLASGAWAGGLVGLALAVLSGAERWDGTHVAVARRFSRLAGWCAPAAVLTGLGNAWVQLPGPAALVTTAYGRALAVKLLGVLALLGWGAVNRFAVLPRLGGARAPGRVERVFRRARLLLLGAARVPRAQAPARLVRYVRREAVLALLVLGCTAVLVDSTPPRHEGHAGHGAPAGGPFRVTMQELHEQGGVPRGWSFAPPPGNAARGREVFARLGCFACHAVEGESFPPSSGIGPDLTDVGEHHPAGYILESILNPDAVIVEGPGHTGPDGRSRMPDYRDQLTVGELIDLVAYLESLSS